MLDAHHVYIISSGTPHTLSCYLSTHIPLLFPADSSVATAYALIQGVLAPPEAEMAWVGACLAGADGWVNICVGAARDVLGGPGR
jgi:autophagy-related protein 5